MKRTIRLSAILSISLLCVMYYLYFHIYPKHYFLKDNPILMQTVQSEWDKGNVIALIRHEERLDRVMHDRSLHKPTGLSEKGKRDATILGENFVKVFPLAQTDIYHNLSKRTVQTASNAFKDKHPIEPWAKIDCEKQFTPHLIQKKQANKNLIFVTHHYCIKQLIKESSNYTLFKRLKWPYGSEVFFTLDKDKQQFTMIGYTYENH